ncbi:alpha-galactosidase [Streptomyces heilongjiangensis]|uniref:alpha-galactosidase n=1 Tax=Streptomyces heilongjiangensis TaxID=945052 RepID=A0ABW1BH41_9ACTN|nr:alpha-galactosidase [Streptomyces heilongjiangensis]MDC2952145.1 alpha-galactosidase [Streptomyces heilongjiangensis]
MLPTETADRMPDHPALRPRRDRPADTSTVDRLLHLQAADVSLVLDCRGPRLPRVLHWGADLGELPPGDLEALALMSVPPVVSNAPDVPVLTGLVPEHSAGWAGHPGLLGHRQGRDWSVLWETTDVTSFIPVEGGGRVEIRARDTIARLELELFVELDPGGLLRTRAVLRNTDVQDPFTLEGLTLALPVPAEATELLDLTGRHCRERSPQRTGFTVGTRVRDGRRGRTGADATLVLVAGEEGFGFRTGQVWGLHVGWSGNHRTYAERLPSGERLIGGGELLLSGEVRLGPGESYESPWLYGTYGQGLDDMSARFHRHLRARMGHPSSPRPVVVNTWEAVYFDHDLDRLHRLADAAAEVGAERFVLDDGWFRGRRDDRAGLGDWYVDETVWPEGLGPLADHVRSLGMEFGLWVEPEMINADSDLARAHPDWILSTGGRLPIEARHQQVLDLTQPEAYDYVLARLDALVREYDLSYLKWDHNRDLVDAGSGRHGEPAVHRQTLAVYRLLDTLRERHPLLEIESCSSGGARIDLGILGRTDRVWTSDCNDALERQGIQRWTALLIPPELMGAHVGPARSHSTSRTHDLSFRAGTALFGHFGIEWDLTSASEREREELTRWVVLYKELRGLLHQGTVVRSDHPDPALWVHGVVAPDASDAVFALAATGTSVSSPHGRVRLPGLAPQAHYLIRPLPPGDSPQVNGPGAVPWLAEDTAVRATGAVLAEVGVQVPALHPEQILLLRVTAC